MTIDIDLHLDQGLRLSAARRGPRQPIGPPVARIDRRGGAPPDPLTVWFGTLSGGGRRNPATDTPDAGGRDRFVDVEAHLEHLTSLHLDPVDDAVPPVVPRTAPPGLRRPNHDDDRSTGQPATTLRRLAARFLPGRGVGVGTAAGIRWDESEREEVQRQAEAWWERMCANDPVTVRQRLEQAFAAHGFGAAVLAVEDATVSLALNVARAEVLAGRWQRTPGSGRLQRMSRPERHRLHAEMIASATVALAADAVAVAPGAGEVRCGVLQADHPEGRPVVIALARLSRAAVTSEETRARTKQVLLSGASVEGCLLHLEPTDSDGLLSPLDRDHPVIERLLTTVAPG